MDMLLCRLDKDLRYGLEVECKASMDDLADYEAVKGQIQGALEVLRDSPSRHALQLLHLLHLLCLLCLLNLL